MTSWDESKHPRVPAGSEEGGEWTEKVSGAAREAAGSSSYEENREELIQEFHQETRQMGEQLGMEEFPRERAVMIDLEGSESVEMGKGSETSISFSEWEKWKQKGTYLVHNHPQDMGLSHNDLLYSMKADLRGMIATTPTGYHELNLYPPAGGWDENLVKSVNDLYVDNFFRTQYRQEYQIGAGEITAKEAARTLSGIIMNQVEERYPDEFDYKFIEW